MSHDFVHRRQALLAQYLHESLSMSTRAALLGESLQCLRWLHVNVIQSRCVSLSEEQLQQLSLAVGDDAVRVRLGFVRCPRVAFAAAVRCASSAVVMLTIDGMCASRSDTGSHGDGCGGDDGPRRGRRVVCINDGGSTVGRREGAGVSRLQRHGVMHAVTHVRGDGPRGGCGVGDGSGACCVLCRRCVVGACADAGSRGV